MTNALSTSTVKGFTAKAVIERIANMDIDAGGNSEKAAWKRYLSLCLLATAKGVDKKDLIKGVFGDGKASKTFQNMWSLAAKCRHMVVGNRDWESFVSMGIDEAQNETISMINRHMAMLDVSSKNTYEPLCGLTMLEVERAKAATKAKADEAAALKDAADEKAETEKATKAATAKDKADTAPDRTPAQAAIAALMESTRDDRMQVMSYLVGLMSIEDLTMVHEGTGAMIENWKAANGAKTIDVKAA